MKQFRIFQYGKEPYNKGEQVIYAIKEGFSWPAFFLNIFWLVYSLLFHRRIVGVVDFVLKAGIALWISAIVILAILYAILWALLFIDEQIISFLPNHTTREVLEMLPDVPNVAIVLLAIIFILSIPFIFGVFGNRLLVLFSKANDHNYKEIVSASTPKGGVLLYKQQHENS
jgi:hypothetical protein